MPRRSLCPLTTLQLALALLLVGAVATPCVHAELKAGAVAVDVTPIQFPVLVNGGMLARSVDTVHTRINARALRSTSSHACLHRCVKLHHHEE